MRGFAVLLRKELREQVRTTRLLVVGAIFLFFGLQSPLLAKYTPQLLEVLAPEMEIILPPPTTADAVNQFLKNMVQVGPFAAILLTMGSVAREKERGTAALVLTKPAGRSAFLLAKFVALLVTLGGSLTVTGVATYAYTVALFPAPSALGFAGLCGLILLELLVYTAITFLGSTLLSSALPAAGLGLGIFLLLAILSALPTVGRFTPGALREIARQFALSQPTAGIRAPMLASCALIAVALGLALLSFREQEL